MALSSYTRRTFGRELLLLIGALVFCLPLYLLITISMKEPDEVVADPLGLPRDPSLDAFGVAWREAGVDGLGSAMLSSFVITVGSVLCLIAIGSLGAYVLARRPGRLSTGLYVLFLLGFIVPVQLAIIPLYVVFNQLGLVGSLAGMVVLYTGMMMPLAVFLYTGFFRALPKEYEEAAQVDGAGQLRTYVKVIFPLLTPVTGTVAILAGMVIWNDFFIPLIFLAGSDHETLPVAVYSFVGEYSAQWSNIFAAVLVSTAPVILFYLFAQRQLIRGFSGGLKG